MRLFVRDDGDDIVVGVRERTEVHREDRFLSWLRGEARRYVIMFALGVLFGFFMAILLVFSI